VKKSLLRIFWLSLALFLFGVLVVTNAEGAQAIAAWRSESGDDYMRLFETKEQPCKNGGMNMFYVAKGHIVVHGCWIFEPDDPRYVHIETADGDVFNVRASRFKWAPGKGPVTL
jgi:hypothetical protein